MSTEFNFRQLEEEGVRRVELRHHLTLEYNPSKSYEAKIISRDGEEMYCRIEKDEDDRYHWVVDGVWDDCENWPITNIEDFRMIAMHLTYFAWNEGHKSISFNF